jgi:hypothetical protein
MSATVLRRPPLPPPPIAEPIEQPVSEVLAEADQPTQSFQSLETRPLPTMPDVREGSAQPAGTPSEPVDPDRATEALPLLPNDRTPRFSNRIRRLGPQDASPSDPTIIPGFGDSDGDEGRG